MKRTHLDLLDGQLLRRAGDLRWRDARRDRTIRIGDIFSGCGGMSLGAGLAVLDRKWNAEFALAVDTDMSALRVHEANLKTKCLRADSVVDLFSADLKRNPRVTERELASESGTLDILLGGPPCQGNSNLNNYTRRDDHRNGLYYYMARAAQILGPRVVIIENVPTVTRDRSGVVDSTVAALSGRLKYKVGQLTVPMTATGVPQSRKRFVILAVRDMDLDPQTCLEDIASNEDFAHPRTVRWAIHDLRKAASASGRIVDTPSNPSPANRHRIDWLFEHEAYDLPNARRPQCHQDGDHSYRAVYGRMHWDAPAPTITTGFRCNGQGRYVHPSERRTLTPHEAARIQTFPDFFDFEAAGNPTVMARMIGNAVPPFFTRALTARILDSW